MPLILAIEPDEEQARRLSHLIRDRVGAEIVHAETTDRALAALATVGDRVPDLVLVPSLLSPQEDTTLAGALRVIAAAANVPMLTIPVLADPEQPRQARGLLARWRGRTPKGVPGACDPAVFAEQIAAYLPECLTEEPEFAAAHAATPPPQVEPLPLADVPGITPDPLDNAAATAPPLDAPIAASSAEMPARAAAEGDAIDLTLLERVADDDAFDSSVLPVEVATGPARSAAISGDQPAVPATLPEPLVEDSPDRPDAIASGAPLTPPIPPNRPTDSGDAQLVEALIAPLLKDLEAVTAEPIRTPHLEEDPPPALGAMPAAIRRTPPLDPELDIDPLFFVDDPDTPQGREAPSAAPQAERPAWLELIDSLRQDVERLKREQQHAVSPWPAAPTPAAPQRKLAHGRRAAKPLQDQWGLFDPEQCGFGALLAKLDEVSAREYAAE